MTHFKDIIDSAQLVLQDSANLFTRAELLNWCRDGIRVMGSQSGALRTFKTYDMPPRHSYAITYEWEKRYVDGGSFRKFTFSHATARVEATSLFEVPQSEGVTTIPGLLNVTQLWEIARAGEEVEAHCRVYLPKSESYLKGVWWDHKRIPPTGLKNLDNLEDHWWRVNGEPYEFTYLGRNHTIDLYEFKTDYVQAYDLKNRDVGMPTDFSGDRTYTVDAPRGAWTYAYTHSFEAGSFTGLGLRLTRLADVTGFAGINSWEDQLIAGQEITETGRAASTASSDEHISLGLGVFRGARSPDRQYICEQQWAINGIARSFGSSEENLLVLYAGLAFPEDVTEWDDLEMFPAQMAKYLRFYVLEQAFNHQGEGYDGFLAMFYQQRFARSIRLLRRLANVAHRDASYQRYPVQRAANRIPQPQLPSNYPRAPWL